MFGTMVSEEKLDALHSTPKGESQKKQCPYQSRNACEFSKVSSISSGTPARKNKPDKCDGANYGFLQAQKGQ